MTDRRRKKGKMKRHRRRKAKRKEWVRAIRAAHADRERDPDAGWAPPWRWFWGHRTKTCRMLWLNLRSRA